MQIIDTEGNIRSLVLTGTRQQKCNEKNEISEKGTFSKLGQGITGRETPAGWESNTGNHAVPE